MVVISVLPAYPNRQVYHCFHSFDFSFNIPFMPIFSLFCPKTSIFIAGAFATGCPLPILHWLFHSTLPFCGVESRSRLSGKTFFSSPPNLQHLEFHRVKGAHAQQTVGVQHNRENFSTFVLGCSYKSVLCLSRSFYSEWSSKTSESLGKHVFRVSQENAGKQPAMDLHPPGEKQYSFTLCNRNKSKAGKSCLVPLVTVCNSTKSTTLLRRKPVLFSSWVWMQWQQAIDHAKFI